MFAVLPSKATLTLSRPLVRSLQLSLRNQSSHHKRCFIDLASVGDSGLLRLHSTLPHRQAAALFGLTVLNHQHLIILAFVHAVQGTAKINRTGVNAQIIQKLQVSWFLRFKSQDTKRTVQLEFSTISSSDYCG